MHERTGPGYLAAAVTSAIVACAAPAMAGSYAYTRLDVPGQTGTFANGINDSGVVVGSSGQSGFVWQNGIYTTVNPIAGNDAAQVIAVNAKGIAAGDYLIGPDYQHASFTYSVATGAITILGPSPSVSTFVTAINGHGTVAGFASTLGQHSKTVGYVTTRTSYKTIKPPGTVNATGAVGISDSGLVAGSYRDVNDVSHGYTYQSGIYSVLDVPGAFGTDLRLVTPGGVIGGDFVTDPATGAGSGFVYNAGSFTTFAYPGAMLTEVTAIGPGSEIIGVWFNTGFAISSSFVVVGGAYYNIVVPGSLRTDVAGVNSQGTLVGSYQDHKNVWHGFIATCAADQTPCTQ